VAVSVHQGGLLNSTFMDRAFAGLAGIIDTSGGLQKALFKSGA
jgi:hypothetical protein